MNRRKLPTMIIIDDPHYRSRHRRIFDWEAVRANLYALLAMIAVVVLFVIIGQIALNLEEARMEQVEKNRKEMQYDTTGRKPQADVVTFDAQKFLQQVGKGKMVYDLGNAIQDVVAGVKEACKVGEISLKLKVTPSTQNSADSVIVEYEIKGKRPKLKEAGTLFFPTRANGLSRKNEDQMDFIDED